MPLKDHLLELGLEIAARLSNQEQAVANARAATTELSRARVERDAVELYLADLEETAQHRDDDAEAEETQASGS